MDSLRRLPSRSCSWFPSSRPTRSSMRPPPFASPSRERTSSCASRWWMEAADTCSFGRRRIAIYTAGGCSSSTPFLTNGVRQGVATTARPCGSCAISLTPDASRRISIPNVQSRWLRGTGPSGPVTSERRSCSTWTARPTRWRLNHAHLATRVSRRPRETILEW